MEPIERINHSVEPEQIYKTLSKFEQFLVDAFSLLAGIFTLSFGYKTAFRWAVSKFDSKSHTNMAQTAVKTNEIAQDKLGSPLSLLAQKLGVDEDKLGSFNLCLPRRDFTSFPPEIGILSQLERLELDNNRLTSLPPEIGNLSQLRYLALWDNRLTSLPPQIGNLSQLQLLWLWDNRLTSLPPDIGSLSQLRYLALSFNQLTSLPPQIGNLSQLRELALLGNQLTSLPPQIGNLSQLRELALSDNQLSSLPPDIGNLSQLQQLELLGNQLTSLPPQIGNLSQLYHLNLSNNHFTDIPECLFSLPRTCIIDIQNNPIPIERLRALQTRVNTPGYNGPRFNFSIQEEVQSSSTKTADEVIQEWGGDPSKLKDKESLKTWLQRQKDTKDYKDHPNKVKEEIKSILLWMGQLSEGDTKVQAYLIIQEAVATCGDRVALARNDLSCLKKISESGDLSLDQLKKLLIGLHRLEMVKKAAELKLSSMNGRDDIETHLHLMTALKEPLNLPIETNSLLYQGMSGFSEAEIEQIKISILNETSSPEQMISILIASPLWKKKLDTLPEMAPLRTEIEQRKAAFQVAVEGEEAEYHAEFLRLEKEDWNPYLNLTTKLLQTLETKEVL